MPEARDWSVTAEQASANTRAAVKPQLDFSMEPLDLLLRHNLVYCRVNGLFPSHALRQTWFRRNQQAKLRAKVDKSLKLDTRGNECFALL